MKDNKEILKKYIFIIDNLIRIITKYSISEHINSEEKDFISDNLKKYSSFFPISKESSTVNLVLNKILKGIEIEAKETKETINILNELKEYFKLRLFE